MGILWQDLRYGLRMLAKVPGFTAVAVLSLTLGIGANTTIFTLVKAIFLQSIPVKDPGRVVLLYSNVVSRKGPPQEYLNTPYPNAMDYREKTNVFSGSSVAIPALVNLVVSGKQMQLFCDLVNANFFDVLGVHPVIGRGFSPEEDAAPSPVVMLSYSLWNKQFGADRNVLGRTIQLDQIDYTVVGVAPLDFQNIGSLGSPDVWIPISMRDEALKGLERTYLYDRSALLASMVARLKPGVTLAQAQNAVHALGSELEKEYPKNNGGRNEMVVPITDTSIPPQLHRVFARAGALMMGIVGLVLLIACANIANLLLARGTQRQREIGVRLALGASRRRLVRQLLTESLLIGVVAGALGIFCAYWGRSLVLSFLPDRLPNLDFSLDGRVLLYTIGLTLAATVLFGLVPALQVSRTDRIAALQNRASGPTGSARWYGLRGVLVMIQVALSLVALVSAGLFIHSLRNAEAINPGFEVKHELVMLVNLSAEHYAQPQAEAFYQDVVARLNQLPIVAGASIADNLPLNAGLQRTTFTDGVDTTDPRNGKLTPVESVEPGFFATAGITLLQGRDFNASDDANNAMVAVVNGAAARTFWPGQDPIGKHLHFLEQTWVVTVVGEVKTVKRATLGESPQPIVYWPLKQHYGPMVVLYVRTKGDPMKAIPSVRNTVRSLIPHVPLLRVETVGQDLADSLTAPRVGAELLGVFSLLALLLAAIGTYGVMSYSVSQRTHEIGIRIALGAHPRDILRLIIRQGLQLVLVGLILGIGASLALTRFMSALLFEVSATDPITFTVVAVLLTIVALLACYIPARRAMRTDPMVALRHE